MYKVKWGTTECHVASSVQDSFWNRELLLQYLGLVVYWVDKLWLYGNFRQGKKKATPIGIRQYFSRGN